MTFSVGFAGFSRRLAGRGTIRETAPLRREPVGAEGDATIRWGGESRFDVLEETAPTQPIFVNFPRDDVQDEEAVEGLVYTEVTRQTITRRVTNPDDPADFVDVEDTTEITLQRADGAVVTLKFAQQS